MPLRSLIRLEAPDPVFTADEFRAHARIRSTAENDLIDGYIAAATAYLEGEQGPQLDQMEDFNTDGIKLKGRLDVGAAWIDYRGAVKNPGS